MDFRKPNAILTVSLLVRNNQFYLARKKRGLGAGYLDGPGGHVEEGESMLAANWRETKEESSVEVRSADEIGIVMFKFRQEDVIYEIHFMLVTDFEGEPKESDELELGQWYPMDLGALPLKEMWEGDPCWLKYFFGGLGFWGFIIYNNKQEKRLEYEFVVSRLHSYRDVYRKNAE